jgi:hypothetical protein
LDTPSALAISVAVPGRLAKYESTPSLTQPFDGGARSSSRSWFKASACRSTIF